MPLSGDNHGLGVKDDMNIDPSDIFMELHDQTPSKYIRGFFGNLCTDGSWRQVIIGRKGWWGLSFRISYCPSSKTVVVERRRILWFKHIAKFYLLDFNSAQEIVDKILSLFDFESIPSMKKGHRRSAKSRKNGSK